MTDQYIKNVQARPAVHARRMADDLRKLALTIERHVEQYLKDVDEPAAAHRLTGRVVHETSWAWANLNFDLLVQSGIDVDVAIAALAQIKDEDNWEYSVGGHENVIMKSKGEAILYNDRLVGVDIDPGTIIRRRPGSKPTEWEVAP